MVVRDYARLEAACRPETPGALSRDHRGGARAWQALGAEADPVAAHAFGQSVGGVARLHRYGRRLRYLKRFFKLAVLSNVDRASFTLEREARLTFDLVLTEDIGSYKPARRNFRESPWIGSTAPSALAKARCSTPYTASSDIDAGRPVDHGVGCITASARSAGRRAPTTRVADIWTWLHFIKSNLRAGVPRPARRRLPSVF